MSNSRLEKFIYAICSMEVSDLPAPLSRIEILWNCLITGETPDFEPQSRNEQYLMAMLGLYELENLPTPMSRGEKLLYKIAIGETDLSDVPGYLSRYEELLKYLIENGVLSDFEYVLYTLNQSLSTLYQTVEKPVKSAILSGQTLVNHASRLESILGSHVIEISENRYRINCQKSYQKVIIKYDGSFNVGSKIMYKLYDIVSTFTSGFVSQTGAGPSFRYNVGETHNTTIVHTITSSETNYGVIEFQGTPNDGYFEFSLAILDYQDGMENWDIPHFNGMQSVKMPVLTTTGKNLFNDVLENGWLNTVNGENVVSNNYVRAKNYTELMGNEVYSINTIVNVYYYDVNKDFISLEYGVSTFTTPLNCAYVRFCISDATQNLDKDIQIEQGTQITSYEPYKSNILTVNEDVELRGIGDVRDELDLLTGEVTQRIEYTEDFISYFKIRSFNRGFTLKEDYHLGRISSVYYSDSLVVKPSNSTSLVLGNSFSVSIDGKSEDIIIKFDNYNDWVTLKLKNGLLTKKGYSEDEKGALLFLKENPIKCLMKLKTPTVKTVDLTTVDQDGQPTKLKTFNDISHVEMNADNIIPSVEVEVATKISETLSTLDPQQNDISNTQNKLGQTIDEQSENTDATMMATTEIYEQTL